MIIQRFNIARDGGSRHIETNEGFYFIDYRIGSETLGTVFAGDPRKGGQPVSDQNGIIMILEEAFRVYRVNETLKGETGFVSKHLLRS